MAKHLTTDTLIASVKRRAMLPQTQSTFQEADFLAFANEEMDIGLTPHVLSFHENYFVTYELITLEQGVFRYSIPSRAIGSKLRELTYIDEGGNIFEMTQIAMEHIPVFNYVTTSDTPRAFYVEGNDIVLITTNAIVSGSLKMSYFLRPNELVASDRAAIVTAINRTTGEMAVSSIPSHFSSGTVVDLIRTKSPHHCLALEKSIVSINTTTNTITLDPADIPANFIAGDYICSMEECIIPQIPTDLHSMLAQRIAARCLEALGDAEGLTTANAKLAEMEQKTGSLIDNRVEGAPQKLLATHGFLRQRQRRYFRR